MAGNEDRVGLSGMAVSGVSGRTGILLLKEKVARYHTGKSVRIELTGRGENWRYKKRPL